MKYRTLTRKASLLVNKNTRQPIKIKKVLVNIKLKVLLPKSFTNISFFKGTNRLINNTITKVGMCTRNPDSLDKDIPPFEK
jgi:hypothetical protein